jgi:hypothetical protein
VSSPAKYDAELVLDGLELTSQDRSDLIQYLLSI